MGVHRNDDKKKLKNLKVKKLLKISEKVLKVLWIRN